MLVILYAINMKMSRKRKYNFTKFMTDCEFLTNRNKIIISGSKLHKINCNSANINI